MTPSPALRLRLFAIGGAVVAIALGVQIANGSIVWATLVGLAALLLLLSRCQPLPLPSLALGLVLCGYIVGNRGFAQLSLAGSLPLLPAEAVLLFAGGFMAVQCAWRHELPFRRDTLNLAILAWIIFGTIRVVLDFRIFGVMALRDFALVYYAAFFFVAQEAVRDANSRRFLLQVLPWSCALLAPVYLLYEQFPRLFLQILVLRGNPIIFFKGDLLGMFLAAGGVLFLLRFEATHRKWSALLGITLAGIALSTNNRSSMIGLVFIVTWLALRGRWRPAVTLMASGTVAIIAILAFATVARISWEKTPIFGVYERVVSIVDPMGQRTYRGADTYYKGDNNLFRSVWWRAVFDQTIEGNPYTGLGFGQDLADRFVREYYPESGEEFSTRSPHNVLLTIFARMGAVGLATFAIILVLVMRATNSAIPQSPEAAGPWAAVWIMFVAACFGVVLEGPMGAVVFWSTLGLAHGNARLDNVGPELNNVVDAPLPTSVPSANFANRP